MNCTTTLINLTAIITVQKTNGAYGAHLWNNFANVLNETFVDTATQIIYTWTLMSGTTISPSSYYSVTAQYSLAGVARLTSNDTYIITTTLSGGQTHTLSGHF